MAFYNPPRINSPVTFHSDIFSRQELPVLWDMTYPCPVSFVPLDLLLSLYPI